MNERTGTVANRPARLGLQLPPLPAPVDGASQPLLDVLGAAGAHARPAIGVAALPPGTPVVEVEAIAQVSTGAAPDEARPR